MLTQNNPSRTNLFVVPYIINDRSAQLLMYINDLEAADGAVMIVAIPASSIGLVDLDTDSCKKAKQDISYWADQIAPSFSGFDLLLCHIDSTSRKTLPVHQVGNYQISVAKNIDQLNQQIDWKTYQKPLDFQQRLDTLRKLDFTANFVVAQATKKIQFDGFGIVYPDPGYYYFPTQHEETANLHHYDVRCCLLADNKDYFNFVYGEHIYQDDYLQHVRVPRSSHETSYSLCQRIVECLPRSAICSETGQQIYCHPDIDEIKTLNMCDIFDWAKNQNIWMLHNRDTDILALTDREYN